ncbi:terminase small subunit [Rhizobium leguminosarum]|uniref:terminase small subunit n=1 Tax=Rhizobium leguminosarum TaxID=384 RepID=UPI000E0F4230|nr:terminase small subunit [Rhizobium leguminosarum]MBY5462318.1 hypothetical protein [Rhizobium leguminosarum]
MAELTPKQRLYVAEYLKDLNAKHAAMRTGYSGKSRVGLAASSTSRAIRLTFRRPAIGAGFRRAHPGGKAR